MKQLICIVCPKGCRLNVDAENHYAVTGNSCPRGEEYGKTELMNPVRVVTSTVKIENGIHRRCPVKTDRAIPKDLVFNVIELLKDVELTSPVKRGDIVIANLLGTEANVVVTKDM